MLELGYCNIKGQAELSRILLNYLGLEYKDHHPNSAEEWYQTEKQQLDAPFPNLPYLKDGDFIVTESCAIPFYLACKADRKDLLGLNAVEQSHIKSVDSVASEIVQVLFKYSNSPNYEAEYKQAFSDGGTVLTKIEQISNLLGDKEWLFGHLTLADFRVYHALDWARIFAISTNTPCPVCVFENVRNLMKRISDLPRVKEFLSTRGEIQYMPTGFMRVNMLTTAEICGTANHSQ